jgi:hypothetical protein
MQLQRCTGRLVLGLMDGSLRLVSLRSEGMGQPPPPPPPPQQQQQQRGRKRPRVGDASGMEKIDR